ncbi:MAG: hypothetical protein P4L11_11390 [Geothrix sp.]|nr:hypothetical protein [Geothrix sp.]
MMTFLEVLIKKATLKTPSGSSCRVGDASFTVRYCSDIWEWEYLGETFWDVQDLAKAIARGSSATHPISFLSRETKSGGRSLKTRLLRLGASGNPGSSARKVFPDRLTIKMSPVPRRLVNFRSLWVH